MSKETNGKIRIDKKKREILVVGGLAIALTIAVWQVFFTDRTQETTAVMSENEKKVSRILKEIDGVGEASVMICETEDGVRSVVVVCEGANNLHVLMNVREAVAAALGTEEKAIKVYLKKE